MKKLLPLTPEQLARAEERLLNPKPGSKIAAAKAYGIDLTLLISQLRLTPEERLRKLESYSIEAERYRGAARRLR